MNKTEIRETILSGLEKFLVDKGFQCKITSPYVSVRRRFREGSHDISIWVDGRGIYELYISIGIRIDSIARIYSYLEEVKDDKNQATLWDGLGFFIEPDKYYLNDVELPVSTKKEISKAIDFMKPIILEKVIPMFDSCMDVGAFDRLINSNAGSRPIFGKRVSVFTAISAIAARLAGNPDFENLLKAYENDFPVNHLKKDLAGFLRGYDVNHPPILPPPPNKDPDTSFADWPVGQTVKHPIGVGKVVAARGRGLNTMVTVEFPKHGVHTYAVGLCMYHGQESPLEKI
ncbi:MAG TPA: hypothetical protein VJ001_11255 [Rhodocyclaceae bacterium]|nr:hypothetical protein [Rhodocyclaceae bacterium]